MTSVDTHMQQLRQAFFARRNGIVADALRRSGDPHELIMGCQLFEVAELASTMPRDAALASALWSDRRHRECRMAATMLYPVEEFTMTTAMEWAADTRCCDEADVLCHRLLRHSPLAPALWREMVTADNGMLQYVGLRLLLNLLIAGAEPHAEQVNDALGQARLHPTPAIANVLRAIADECEEPKLLDKIFARRNDKT